MNVDSFLKNEIKDLEKKNEILEAEVKRLKEIELDYEDAEKEIERLNTLIDGQPKTTKREWDDEGEDPEPIY